MYQVARMTFFQLARDRIFQLTFVFFIALLAINFLFSEMSIAEKKRIYVNFGMSLIHMISIFISIVLSVMTYRRVIASKSLYTILVRPISRETYTLGQFFGVAAVVSTLVVLFSLILLTVFLLGYEPEFYWLFWVAVVGILVESWLAISLALFLAIVMSYPIAIGLSFAVVVVGHWMSSFRFFLNQADDYAYKFTGELIYWILPHLERVNFRYWPIVPDQADISAVYWGVAQILAYCLFFISLACLAVRSQDLD